VSIVPSSVRCDGCGKNRIEDGNHWHTLRAPGADPLQITKGVQTAGYGKHACGEACAMKLVSRWMATGTLEEKT